MPDSSMRCSLFVVSFGQPYDYDKKPRLHNPDIYFLEPSTSIRDLKAYLAATPWKHIGQPLQCRGMIPTVPFAPTFPGFSSKGSDFNANGIGP